VGAVIAKGGRKSINMPALYIHLSPGESFIGGGIYKPEKEALYQIRKAFANQPNEVHKLLTDPVFKKRYGGFAPSETNKIIPKEFQEAARKQPLIFNKQFYFMATFENGENFVTQDNLLQKVMEYHKALLPWNDFLTKALV
jgi:uncharacterized protein (TIGR02453 family)